MLNKLLFISLVFMVGAIVFLGFSYVIYATRNAPNLSSTYIANKAYYANPDQEKQNVIADYLTNSTSQKFNDFTESSIDPNGFYIRIDKINLFKAIVLNVNPNKKDEYVSSWDYGISHGLYTATPEKIGITYLFAHAVFDKSQAEAENAWFSNLDQIKKGDEIIIYYQGKKYTYVTNDFKVVSPDATGYYTGVAPVQILRMQYCAPPTGSLESRTLIDSFLLETEEI